MSKFATGAIDHVFEEKMQKISSVNLRKTELDDGRTSEEALLSEVDQLPQKNGDSLYKWKNKDYDSDDSDDDSSENIF